MQNEELFESIYISNDFIEDIFGVTTKMAIFAVTAIFVLGLYVSYLWTYSDNSYSVLKSLYIYKESLQEDVKKMKNENAILQYEYFELKEVSAQ